MGSSAGRRSANYVRHRTLYQQGNHPCWLQNGPWCTGIGTTPDHDPPLSTAATPQQWRGVLRPACRPCQDHQGNALRNQQPTWTF